MKPAEMRERTIKDLVEMNKELRRELWQARLDNFTNKLDDTAKLRRLRRDIARLKTVLAQKQRSEG
jgi:large subunit ribosomal protein L29